MKKEEVTIKSKSLKEPKTAVYEYPETLEEAMKVDGAETVFKLYAQQRKIRFMDARRRVMTGGGVTSAMAKAVKSASPEKLAQIAKLLGDPSLVEALKG